MKARDLGKRTASLKESEQSEFLIDYSQYSWKTVMLFPLKKDLFSASTWRNVTFLSKLWFSVT